MIRHIRMDLEFEWMQNLQKDNYVMRAKMEQDWKTTCHLLKQMSSLSTLHIRIGRGRYHTRYTSSSSRLPVQGQSPESKILSMLIGVYARTSFVVEMPWSEEIRNDLPGAAFNMVISDPYPNAPLVQERI